MLICKYAYYMRLLLSYTVIVANAIVFKIACLANPVTEVCPKAENARDRKSVV